MCHGCRLQEFQRKSQAVAAQLLRGLAIGLGLPEDYFQGVHTSLPPDHHTRSPVHLLGTDDATRNGIVVGSASLPPLALAIDDCSKQVP